MVVEGEQGKILGFLFYQIIDNQCEIVVFEVFTKFQGIGTIMLNQLKEMVKSKKLHRIYLMTTNDNLDALRFYQRRGFTICGIHLNAIEEARKIKPRIGLIGDYNIHIRDEIDLELRFEVVENIEVGKNSCKTVEQNDEHSPAYS